MRLLTLLRDLFPTHLPKTAARRKLLTMSIHPVNRKVTNEKAIPRPSIDR